MIAPGSVCQLRAPHASSPSRRLHAHGSRGVDAQAARVPHANLTLAERRVATLSEALGEAAALHKAARRQQRQRRAMQAHRARSAGTGANERQLSTALASGRMPLGGRGGGGSDG